MQVEAGHSVVCPKCGQDAIAIRCRVRDDVVDVWVREHGPCRSRRHAETRAAGAAIAIGIVRAEARMVARELSRAQRRQIELLQDVEMWEAEARRIDELSIEMFGPTTREVPDVL